MLGMMILLDSVDGFETSQSKALAWQRARQGGEARRRGRRSPRRPGGSGAFARGAGVRLEQRGPDALGERADVRSAEQRVVVAGRDVAPEAGGPLRPRGPRIPARRGLGAEELDPG